MRYAWPMNETTTYLDNNATTRIDPRVVDAMLPFFTTHWGNASSAHRVGRGVTAAVAQARRTVADCLEATPGEVVFTASGTEADNLAIRGVVAANRGGHVVTTAVEHPAVLETCRELAQRGDCELTVLPVNADGGLDLDELQASLRPGRTCLVSVMWSNNETGVVFPLAEIADRVHAAEALLHVDGVQAMGKLPLSPTVQHIDLLAFSAHKFHGPKGVGGLLVRRGTKIAPATTGGGQERGRRSGTENPAGIVGLALALHLAVQEQPNHDRAIAALRDRLQAGLANVGGLQVTAPDAPRVSNTLHLTLPVEAEPVLVGLDQEGICCSAGSACSTGALEPSHVLSAMGIDASRAHGALRFSLSRETTAAEIDHVLEVLPRVVARVVAVSGVGRG